MIDIKEITIATTPLYQYIELRYFDFYNFLRKDGKFFIECEYKKVGIADYYFLFTNELKEIIENYYNTHNSMVRYNNVYYPEFHNADWRKTNNFIEAKLNNEKI